MNAIWTFEHDRLVARDFAGGLLATRLIDETIGQPLANFLNTAPDLGRTLLPPWAAIGPVHQVCKSLQPLEGAACATYESVDRERAHITLRAREASSENGRYREIGRMAARV
jgi:hypothetical protein